MPRVFPSLCGKQQTPDTILFKVEEDSIKVEEDSIKVEEDIGGGTPAVG